MSEVSVSGRAAQLPACRAAPSARPAGEEINRWLRAVCEQFLERVDAANELALQPDLCAGLPAAALAGRAIEDPELESELQRMFLQYLGLDEPFPR